MKKRVTLILNLPDGDPALDLPEGIHASGWQARSLRQLLLSILRVDAEIESDKGI